MNAKRKGECQERIEQPVLHRPANLLRHPMHHDSAKLSPHRAIESSSERGSMAEKRYQKGQLWLKVNLVWPMA